MYMCDKINVMISVEKHNYFISCGDNSLSKQVMISVEKHNYLIPAGITF